MICKRKSIFIFLLIAFNIYIAALVFTQIVEATGGAFTSTKMGGNDLDSEGITMGVNRSTNSGVLSLGGNAVPAYSVYSSGECNHCHELHGSFGGSEPDPVDSGPHPYMTFKNAQIDMDGADFCLYCHDQFDFTSINSSDSGLGDPPAGFGSLGVFQNGSGDIFKNSSHGTKAGFLWPKPIADPNPTIHPRKERSTGKRTCLNCHTPHGILKSGLDVAAVPDNVQAKPANHPDTLRALVGDIIVPYLIPRNKIAWEEALCENCHDSSGSAGGDTSPPDIQTEINKRDMPACGGSGCGSGHPVDRTAYSGQHSTKEPVENLERHVECYDCHNPHAVRNPADFSSGDAGRIKGTKYVTIDGTIKIGGVGGAREPYIMELCFRCHGDTFAYVSRRSASDDSSNANPFVAEGASLGDYGGSVTRKKRGNYTGSGNNDQLGWSNKRLEFNVDTDHTAAGQTFNTAYHPVSEGGRNLSLQLCNQLQSAFSLNCGDPAAALQNLTINCTDCHNNEDTGGSNRGPVTESSLRSAAPAIDVASVYGGASPVGPHGSDYPRILRAYYNTRIDTPPSDDDGFDFNAAINAIPTNFALCFLCHNSGPFVNSDYLGAGENWTNFHGQDPNEKEWDASLHWYHLSMEQKNGTTYIKCHECHNNVHSNVEANNMQYTNGSGGGFTADGNTHLLNFGPQEVADQYAKPAWYFDSTDGVFRCNLFCHGIEMRSCSYLGKNDGGPDGDGRCG